MIFVSDDNFDLYAYRYYDNPSCATRADFEEDLSRIKFILKMFKRYEKDGLINERLVINHLTLLYNVFEREACTRLLALKLANYMHLLKPFLILLNYWPEKIQYVGNAESVIIGTDISMDPKIVEKLRKI